MSIRVKIVCFFLLLTSLLVALAGDLWLMLDNARHLTMLQVMHYKADNLADGLRRSSDDLTRMARSFVATGDQRFLDYYRHIVAIRDGDEPMPQGYNSFYWDYVTARHDYRPGAGQPRSLVERLKEVNIAEQEFSLLAEAKSHSDDLVEIELQAFAALQAGGEDSRDQALQLVYGMAYHQAKAAIMAKIDGFDRHLDERLLEIENQRERRQDNYMLVAIVLVLAILGVSVLSAYLFIRDISLPLGSVIGWVRQMQEGEYRFNAEQFKKDEIGVLAHAFAGLAQKIQADIADLEFISSTDPLTAVKNRIVLDKALNNARYAFDRYGIICTVLMLDIDHFKQVNDTHGHVIGDKVLVELAGVLADSTRETDIVGRWGGEEFMVICPSTNFKSGLAMAELIRKRIAEQDFAEGLKMTISVGVGAFIAGETIDKTIARVDAALYRAKAEGRNRVCCDTES